MERDQGDLRKVLLLVAELHVRGYQRLRIVPGMAPSGCYWRCAIMPVLNIRSDNGALPVDWDGPVAIYSSGDGTDYFRMNFDAKYSTPSQCARRFIDTYPEIAAAGTGRDWLYVGWYQEMLALTYPDRLPIAYWDAWQSSGGLDTVGSGERRPIPSPPHGEGAPRREA